MVAETLNRYSIINEKNKREIVLLRGKGCAYKKCRFCDYHLDASTNENDNYLLNQDELSKVTGVYQKLEIINSGSFTELDNKTMNLIIKTCREKKIQQIHFESHWMYRSAIRELRNQFAKSGITVKMKIGVETFDERFRESYLVKGIDASIDDIGTYFDEVCLLFGLHGQTVASMENDIAVGLLNFERICVNIMQENSMPIKPDQAVINQFIEKIYPKYKEEKRMDILISNTDFGVGEQKANAE